MSAIEQEVASQPAVWREAARLEAGDVLPGRGTRLGVIGCGTSFYVAAAYAALREAAGHGETDAFPASEFPTGRAYGGLLAISRSGTTTEVLDAVAVVGERVPTVAITAVAESPLALAGGRVVTLPFADEQSVVQTRFATATLVLLGAHVGIDPAPAVAAAERVLERPLPIDPAGFDRFNVLGRGWTVGLAYEAALKLREAAQAWSEAYPAMEYRHGPIAIAAPGRAVWAFGEVPDALPEQVAATGATFVHSGQRDPLADLIVAQRFAVALAVARGLDPDRPRHLTRSVILS